MLNAFIILRFNVYGSFKLLSDRDYIREFDRINSPQEREYRQSLSRLRLLATKFKTSGSFSRPSCKYSGIWYNMRCSRRRILSHSWGNCTSLHEIRSATSIVDSGDVITTRFLRHRAPIMVLNITYINEFLSYKTLIYHVFCNYIVFFNAMRRINFSIFLQVEVFKKRF